MKINAINNERYINILCFIGLITYRILLDFSYKKIVYPQWGYQGFMLEYNNLYIIISWIFIIILSPLIIKTFRTANISSNILSILILVSLVPTTSIIAFSNYKYEFIYLNFIYWTIILLTNFLIPSIVWKIEKPRNNKLLNDGIIIILCITVVYISFIYTGFRLHFGLFDVYDLRLEAREYNLPTILSYLSTAANTILPIIFIYYIIKKRKVLAILIGLIIFLNFGIAGSKSVILLLFIALIGYFIVKSIYNSLYLIYGFIVLVSFSLLEKNIFNTIFLSFFSTYRLIFLPSRINFIYYDFFSIREFDYFRQSILKWSGLQSPYKENIAFLIGYYDLGETGGRANNGLFSDAYSNLGPIGMIVFPIILIIILKIIEGSTKAIDERLLFIITVCTAMNLLSLPLSTAFLTGGLLLMIFFLYTVPRINYI